MSDMSSRDSLQISLLWVVVLSSALTVAYVSHVCRQKYDQLTALEREKNNCR